MISHAINNEQKSEKCNFYKQCEQNHAVQKLNGQVSCIWETRTQAIGVASWDKYESCACLVLPDSHISAKAG